MPILQYMKIKLTFVSLVALMVFYSCNKKTVTANPAGIADTLYFPPQNTTAWETVPVANLGWDAQALNGLVPYLKSKNTKAFIILKNGKIAFEQYFDNFTTDSIWYWASAGKTMTAFLVGIAQQEGLLNINDVSSKYLGTGWTSAPPDKENKITIRHQLTMTTGLDDGVPDNDCTLPSCLIYKADAGTRWAYHTGAYTLLDQVIANASGMSFNNYFQQKIRNPIGMTGTWIKIPNSNNVYYSNARSMARFGLLLLNKGKWGTLPILSDSIYFQQQVNTSQNLNLSYGYLTWLNGKSSCMIPKLQTVFQQALIPNAPADMYAALGKNDQKIYVVPSQKLVVIRMGNAADSSQLSVTNFDNELWGKVKGIMHL
ncbi:CubicO group peptidase (beta-lactamase class C family) [Hydrotalea sandarakina]|uniref:CubicO group peptidase (Beta-lactamase class C family) n=2 Tax=Hydrotalea sandarakina TaxID=1004304 RepID=A0A2W7RM59_9BACT|nr:CubicO group peptidase (beta-lactamase class C family) [Hydrotalea sandarakina]